MNGITTDFITSGIKVLAQKSGENTIIWQIDGNGNTVGFNYNNTPYFYIKNAQGDITAIADISGNIVAKYTYDSWGKLISIKDSNDVDKTTDENFIGYVNPIRYRGYYYDSETGLYYLNARYYDPEVGRFISADETLSGGYNLFEYCLNNPVNYTDFTGNAPILIDYMRCIGRDQYTDSDGITHMYNCWNNVTNKIDGVYESVDPPGYQVRAGQVRSSFDLALATIAGLIQKNARTVNLLGPLSEYDLLSRMHNLAPNKMLVAFRQNPNPGGDYHYMVYYNGVWTQKYGGAGMLFQLERSITPNADRVWCMHWGDPNTGKVFWDDESVVPVYQGPTYYMEVTIR